MGDFTMMFRQGHLACIGAVFALLASAAPAHAQQGSQWRLRSITVEAPFTKADKTPWDVGIGGFVNPDMKVCVTTEDGRGDCAAECSNSNTCAVDLPAGLVGDSFILNVTDEDAIVHDAVITNVRITPSQAGESSHAVPVADPTRARRGLGTLMTRVHITVEAVSASPTQTSPQPANDTFGEGCLPISTRAANSTKLPPALRDGLAFTYANAQETYSLFRQFEARGGKVIYCDHIGATAFYDDRDTIVFGRVVLDKKWTMLTVVRAFAEELDHAHRDQFGWSHPKDFTRADFVDAYGAELLRMEVRGFAWAMQERETILLKTTKDIGVFPFPLADPANQTALEAAVSRVIKQNLSIQQQVDRFLPTISDLTAWHGADGTKRNYVDHYRNMAGRVWDCYQKRNAEPIRGRYMCKP